MVLVFRLWSIQYSPIFLCVMVRLVRPLDDGFRIVGDGNDEFVRWASSPSGPLPWLLPCSASEFVGLGLGVHVLLFNLA
jgi:hypothetical protein